MKTKQEVIQEAWGEYWDKVKPHIDENGEMLGNSEHYPNVLFNHTGFGYITPLSLAGIETNNGWTVADIMNLPKEGVYQVGEFLDDGTFRYGIDEVEYYELREYLVNYGFTHYQPIIKPLPPIY